jgi:putative cardiolipin synthase
MERTSKLSWLVAAWLGLVAGCATLPEPAAPESRAFSAPETTRLGRLVAPAAEANAPRTGVLLVESGADALRHRHALVETAERAIDAQYYIWNSDISGLLLIARLLEAADRGVRVRLLLDDFNVGDRDPGLAALASHTNVEVRIFNPVAKRSGPLRWFSLLGDLDRLSRRMHNKALLVDGVAGVVGGRNIGDEYFDLDPEMNFRDRDVLVAGPAVTELETGFDGYWNHPLSVPIEALTGPTTDLEERRPRLEALVADIALPYVLPDDDLAWMRDTVLPGLSWVPVEVLYERPGDRLGDGGDKTPLVATRLGKLLDATEHTALIESAYLVLRADARDRVEAAVARGVEVRAFTNSLASNDVLPNHAGYARHRRAMLRQGLLIHEMRPDARACRTPPPGQPGCGDSASYGLHGKSAVFDDRWLFVGSFNLNPRSAYLNTELVLLVDSPALAADVTASIESFLDPGSSWRLTVDDANQLYWFEDPAGEGSPLPHRDPAAGSWRILGADLLQLLPYIDHF